MTKTIPGNLTITEDVLADIAGYAALESYGVVGMTSPTLTDGIAKLLPANRIRRGIVLSRDEQDNLIVDLYIVVEQGVNIPEVSRMLSEQVSYLLEDSAQQKVGSVNVHVQGIRVHEDK